MVYWAAVVLWENNTTAPGSAPRSWTRRQLFSFISIPDWYLEMCAALCGSRSGKLIGHVFPVIQRDSSTYPLLSPPSRVGTSSTSSKLQSRPRDGDRASASGVSLRRGDAEVQVGELLLVLMLPLGLLCFPCCFSPLFT